MRPNTQDIPQTYDIFRSQLTQIINMDHELVSLSKAIDWTYLEEKNAAYYKEEGRPGVSARLMIGLHVLKYMFNLSDEGVCERWVYDPYFQFFCGEIYFQYGAVLDGVLGIFPPKRTKTAVALDATGLPEGYTFSTAA